jgi:hypothetical protein
VEVVLKSNEMNYHFKTRKVINVYIKYGPWEGKRKRKRARGYFLKSLF